MFSTHALPRPLPAPVTTTTRPLNEILPFSVEGKSDIFQDVRAGVCGCELKGDSRRMRSKMNGCER